jgi:galacturonosyltransferase
MAEKGIAEFLEAAEYFHSETEAAAAEFHIVGGCEEQWERRLLELQARGVIVWHGQTEDVRVFHASSHCTIHPSYWEGMSNVVLESASCGRPVITTDIPGCREIVDDGVTGFLVEKQSGAALIGAVRRFLALDEGARKRMGLAGREKVCRAFDRRLVTGRTSKSWTKPPPGRSEAG